MQNDRLLFFHFCDSDTPQNPSAPLIVKVWSDVGIVMALSHCPLSLKIFKSKNEFDINDTSVASSA